MDNLELHKLLKSKNIPLWKIADEIGISETTIYRWFRKPLTNEQYQKIMSAVKQLEFIAYDLTKVPTEFLVAELERRSR